MTLVINKKSIILGIIALAIIVLLAIIINKIIFPKTKSLNEDLIAQQFNTLVNDKLQSSISFFQDNFALNGKVVVSSPLKNERYELSISDFINLKEQYAKVRFIYDGSAFRDKIEELTILELPGVEYINWAFDQIGKASVRPAAKNELIEGLYRVVNEDAEIKIGNETIAFNDFVENIRNQSERAGRVISIGVDIQNNRYNSIVVDAIPAPVIDTPEPATSIIPKKYSTADGTITAPKAPDADEQQAAPENKRVDTTKTAPEPASSTPLFDEEAYKKRLIRILESNFNVIRERGNRPNDIPAAKADAAMELVRKECLDNKIPVIESIVTKDDKTHTIVTGSDDLSLEDYMDNLYEIKVTHEQRTPWENEVDVFNVEIDKNRKKITKIVIRKQ